MAARSGGRLAAATIGRAELGHEVWLSIALTIGDVLGISPGDLFEPPGCGHCDGSPPAGFACPECGRLGGGEVAR
jgi:hypothetical protein